VHRIDGHPGEELLLAVALGVVVDAQRLAPGFAAVARHHQKYVGVAVAQVGPVDIDRPAVLALAPVHADGRTAVAAAPPLDRNLPSAWRVGQNLVLAEGVAGVVRRAKYQPLRPGPDDVHLALGSD